MDKSGSILKSNRRDAFGDIGLTRQWALAARALAREFAWSLKIRFDTLQMDSKMEIKYMAQFIGETLRPQLTRVFQKRVPFCVLLRFSHARRLAA